MWELQVFSKYTQYQAIEYKNRYALFARILMHAKQDKMT